jgi:hypothetical protein
VLKLLIVLVVLTMLVYGLVRVIGRRGILPAKGTQRPTPRPQGPDDDPEFLRDLDRKRRRRQAEGPDRTDDS